MSVSATFIKFASDCVPTTSSAGLRGLVSRQQKLSLPEQILAEFIPEIGVCIVATLRSLDHWIWYLSGFPLFPRALVVFRSAINCLLTASSRSDETAAAVVLLVPKSGHMIRQVRRLR